MTRFLLSFFFLAIIWTSSTPSSFSAEARAVLYEEPLSGSGTGITATDATVFWRYAADGMEGPRIEADLAVPGRGLWIRLAIYRNHDKTLPASHLVEVIVDASPAFPGKSIASVPRIVFKQTEEIRGQPLIGAAARVAEGFFWIGLSGNPTDQVENLAIIRDRNWIDLPLVYETGQRAILTFEKGSSGDAAFGRAFAAWGGALAGRRVALVIGNSSYATGYLKNPRNDAALMTTVLRTAGFDVIELLDANQEIMKRAMIDFGRRLRVNTDAALFYYAGHGVQIDGENFLIPVNADIHDEAEVEFQAINVNDFLGVMEGSATKINIVVLDACRNNPYARAFRSQVRGLAMVDAPSGTYIGFSTAPGRVAADGNDENSPYTKALAAAILVPGRKIEDTFKRAREAVMAATNNSQVPWEATSIVGDFYFVPTE